MEKEKAVNKNNVILNLIQNLQRGLFSLRNDERGRSQIKFGMTTNFMGFTLIELLVVVLIIGILAAVALPQYQKAVLRSRFTQLVTAVRTLRDAEHRYKLSNGEYTQDRDNLDIEFAGSDERFPTMKYQLNLDNKGNCGIEGVTYNVSDSRNHVYCKLFTGDDPIIELSYHLDTSAWRCCIVHLSNQYAEKLCQQEMGSTTLDAYSNENKHCYTKN